MAATVILQFDCRGLGFGMSNQTTHIPVVNAADYVDESGSLVGSAALLASCVADMLKRESRVEVSFEALKSVSSSYFNMLLASLACALGSVDGIKNRVAFDFSADAQRSIFDRSFKAVSQQNA